MFCEALNLKTKKLPVINQLNANSEKSTANDAINHVSNILKNDIMFYRYCYKCLSSTKNIVHVDEFSDRTVFTFVCSVCETNSRLRIEMNQNKKKSKKLKMKKPKITTTTNYNHKDHCGEVNSSEVILIPDQSYSIQEIIDKFTRGVPLPLERNVQYADQDDLEQDFENDNIHPANQPDFDLSDVLSAVAFEEKRQTRKASRHTSPGKTEVKRSEAEAETTVKPNDV